MTLSIEKELRTLAGALDVLGLDTDDGALDALREYRQAIVQWSRRMNLVSRRDKSRLITYHFLDSAEGLAYVREGVDRRVLDLGSGAGFPGVVWKILRPDLDVTLVDSVRKRTLFLESVIRGLGLKGVRVVRERGEVLAESEEFAGLNDVAVARTVAPMGRLVKLCLPLVRTGGRLVAFKGLSVEEEVAGAGPALEQEWGKVVEMVPARSESLQGKRIFVVVEKTPRL